MFRLSFPETTSTTYAGKLCHSNCNPYKLIGEDGPTNVGNFINWEVQEQSFKRWNNMKEQSINMSPATFDFLSYMDVYYSTHSWTAAQ
jgi:hypothetical protein